MIEQEVWPPTLPAHNINCHMLYMITNAISVLYELKGLYIVSIIY